MVEWLGNNGWTVWLIVAAVLALCEMSTLDLTLLMLAIGVAAGGLTALVAPGMPAAHVGVAVAVAAALLLALRPPLLQRMRSSSPGYRNSAEKLLGSTGRAVGAITPTGGEVLIGSDLWSARSYDSSVISEGTEVEVFEVDGLTAVVYPKARPLSA